MPVQYATASDLADYSPDLEQPDRVTDYLRAASLLVADVTGRAVYAINGVGLPTDVALSGAMRDAVCQQVTDWARAGVDPTLGSESDGVSSRTTTAGPRTVTEQYSGTNTATITADELGARAWRILKVAGLLGGPVITTRGAWL